MRRSARWALGILGELLSNAKPGRRYAGPPLTTNNGGRALVTGGTGGIGEEVCRGLAARGYDVYVGARDAAKGEAVAERLREEFPGAHKCVVCDLNGGDTALPRGVNLLVNNAGVMGAATDETMRVNLVAPARLTLGLRARNRKLRVVNVASSSHLRARACPVARMLDDRRRDKSLSAYAASKLGLLQFTAALRNNGVDAAGGQVRERLWNRHRPASRQRCATMASRTWTTHAQGLLPGARARGAAATPLQDAGRGRGDGTFGLRRRRPGHVRHGRSRPAQSLFARVLRHWRTRRRTGRART